MTKLKRSIIAALFLANLGMWSILVQIPQHTRVTALDVGQGDAILIQTPQAQHILIDGGPDASVLAGLGRHLPFFVRTLDLIVVTHPHADHFAGLIDVLRRYRVERMLMTDVESDSKLYQQLVDEIERQHIAVLRPHLGERFYFSSARPDVGLTVLYPFGEFANNKQTNLNNASIVLALHDERDVLFAGDAEKEVEQRLLAAGLVWHADILKVGHHGSSTSSTQAFLDHVRPAIAAISVGAHNKYHHPSPDIVKRLEQAGAEVRRTDQRGDISLELARPP